MTKISKLFPKGRRKAFTLSYDDGATQDRRLVEILNLHRLKATFNLNSGLMSEECISIINEQKIQRINKEEVKELYQGHEVSLHGLTHLSLTDIPKELIVKEVLEDRRNQEELLGYPIRGMAYPFGTYNSKVFEVLEALGVAYSRTVNSHKGFHLPSSYLEWNPTVHHNDPALMKLAEKFVKSNFFDLSIFYVWGHSYEFDLDHNWEVIEKFCEYMSNRDDIWYATNIEIVDYLEAYDRLQCSADLTFACNPSAIPVWMEVDGTKVVINPGETKKL